MTKEEKEQEAKEVLSAAATIAIISWLFFGVAVNLMGETIVRSIEIGFLCAAATAIVVINKL